MTFVFILFISFKNDARTTFSDDPIVVFAKNKYVFYINGEELRV